MVIYNIRHTHAQNTCYNIEFACYFTHCFFRIIYTPWRGKCPTYLRLENVRGMSFQSPNEEMSIRGNIHTGKHPTLAPTTSKRLVSHHHHLRLINDVDKCNSTWTTS